MLRVVTSDPTSPTLEVPIILDPDGSHSLLYPSPESSPHVLTRPNPVRLPAGTGGTVDLCMSALSFEGGSVRMSGMDVVGEGLVLLGVWDSAGSLVDPASGLDLGYGYTISMGYGPESGDPWGYLRLHIENWWGDPITHAIPVFR